MIRSPDARMAQRSLRPQPSTPLGRASRLRWSWARAVLPMGLAFVLLTPAGTARAQWGDFVGPLSDGIFGMRFGMDAGSVSELLRDTKLEARSARGGTKRYWGRIRGQTAEMVLEFAEDVPLYRSGLYQIEILWDAFPGGPWRAQEFVGELESLLQRRYGDPIMQRDASINDLATAHGEYIRVFRGPQVQAMLELRPRGTEHLYVRLVLECPQLDPDSARR